MTEKMERNCGNCACIAELKHPQLVNQKVYVCRRNPPFILQQQVRTEHGIANQQGLSQMPTSPELVCFDGWRPAGIAPGVSQDQWNAIVIREMKNGASLKEVLELLAKVPQPE